MANINVSLTNTFDEWRIKTNNLADAVGDVALFPISIDGVQYNDLLSSLQEITQNANDISTIDTQVIAINTAINNMDILVTGHTSLLQLYSQAHADLDNDKLDLAGGTMTGTIADFTSTGIDDNATSTKLATTSTGIDVTGSVTAGSFIGDGIDVTGSVTAGSFIGDGSALTGIDQVAVFNLAGTRLN